MSMLIAIDGACRRNGKPDCVASGGVFVQKFDEAQRRVGCGAMMTHERGSTNQRGELLALLTALTYILECKEEDTLVVTDSEYIFNAMTKQWYVSWKNNDWCTRSGEPAKNADIWKCIAAIADNLDHIGISVAFYHIKGHVIPIGKITAKKLFEEDPTGAAVHAYVSKRFEELAPTKQTVFNTAKELAERNNGFEPSGITFKSWVTANVVADAIATREVDAADQQS